MISKKAVEEFKNRKLDTFDWIKRASVQELNEAIASLPAQIKLKNEFYKHQKASFYVGACFNEFGYFLDMGVGKSLISLALILYRQKLQQIQRALIIVPNVLNLEGWAEEIEKQTNLEYRLLYGTREERLLELEQDADIYVINYAGLQTVMASLQQDPKNKKKKKRMMDAKLIRNFTSKFQMVIFDEIHICFHKNTKIITSKGEKFINEININDLVKTLPGKFEPVKQIFKNAINLKDVCKVTLKNKTSIFCSKDHLFYTPKGWIKAENLNNEIVFFNCMQYNALKINNTGKKDYDKKNLFKNLRRMWNNFYSNQYSKKKQILQQIVFRKMENEVTSYFKIFSFQRMVRKNEKNASKISTSTSRTSKRIESKKFRAYETKQSHAQTWSKRKSSKNKKSKWNFTYFQRYTRRKWILLERTIDSVRTFIRKFRKLGIRISNKNRAPSLGQKWVSYKLQSRYWKSNISDRNRNRWKESQPSKSSPTRQEKRNEIKRVEVESMEIYKQGNNDRSFQSVISDNDKFKGFIEFYDLEINGHPSYYANNTLVHNCKNQESLIYKLCNQVSKKCKYRLGMTGTPFGRNPVDFWAQFYLMDRGQTLGQTLGLYRAAFFRESYNQWGGRDYTFYKESEPELHRMIKHRSIRYKDSECGDLPKKIDINVPVRMSPDALEYYKQLVEESYETLDSEDVRQNYYAKFRQIASGFVYIKDEEFATKVAVRFSHTEKLNAIDIILDEMPKTSSLIIFHTFTESGKMITEHLANKKLNFAALNSTAETSVQEEYRRFKKEDKCKIAVANIASGSTGLNLQKANYSIFYEPTDRPIWQRQAEKRTHRDGQTKRCYNYHLYVQNTVEERVRGFLKEGKSLFDALVEGKENAHSITTGFKNLKSF